MSPEEMFDPINRPKHYVSETGLEAIDVIEVFAPHNPHRAAALKYLLRAGKKDATEQDLRKAIWWIEREIQRLNKAQKPDQDTLGGYDVTKDVPGAEFEPCAHCHSHVCQVAGSCMYAFKVPIK